MFARPGSNTQTESEDFEVLEDLYSKLIRYCQYLSQNRWDGEDLAQETMYKALKNYEQLNASLLKRMAHNLWMDQLRKRNREVLGFVSDDTQCKDQTEFSNLIERIATDLTPKQSLIYTLKEGFQYQISEIAVLFGMSDTAVKAILYRARKRLSRITDERTSSIHTFWSDEDSETFQTKLVQAIRSENPEVLIRLIPELFPNVQQLKMKLMTPSSSSSSLSMAA